MGRDRRAVRIGGDVRLSCGRAVHSATAGDNGSEHAQLLDCGCGHERRGPHGARRAFRAYAAVVRQRYPTRDRTIGVGVPTSTTEFGDRRSPRIGGGRGVRMVSSRGGSSIPFDTYGFGLRAASRVFGAHSESSCQQSWDDGEEDDRRPNRARGEAIAGVHVTLGVGHRSSARVRRPVQLHELLSGADGADTERISAR